MVHAVSPHTREVRSHVLLGGGGVLESRLTVGAELEGKTTGSFCVVHRVIDIVCVWSR